MERFSLNDHLLTDRKTGGQYKVHHMQGVYVCKIPDLGMFKHAKEQNLLSIVNAATTQIDTRKAIIENATISNVLNKLKNR